MKTPPCNNTTLVWSGEYVNVFKKPLVFGFEYIIKDVETNTTRYALRDESTAVSLAAEIDVLVKINVEKQLLLRR
jgi:hypothetical protein